MSFFILHVWTSLLEQHEKLLMSLEKKRHVWTCPMSVWVSVNFQKSGLPTFPTKLCSSSSSIDRMSLHEIHSKWAGQYNYRKFATNYKRLQEKFQNELCLTSIDSNNPNNTSLNPQNLTENSSRKQDFSKESLYDPVNPKKLSQ